MLHKRIIKQTLSFYLKRRKILRIIHKKLLCLHMNLYQRLIAFFLSLQIDFTL